MMDKINVFWVFALTFVVSLFCLAASGYAMDVTLTWNMDYTVDGYNLYYKAGSSGSPYNGTNAVEGDSPIDVGWISDFTLRALSDDKDYYFFVTAYSQEGESGYSNEVTTAQNSASSGSSGGSGGCFISTIISK